MTEVFLKVLNMSISASWLVLAVLALRLLFRRAPKGVSLLLWAIVAVRLICPVTLESALSLVPSAETVAPEIMMDWTPQIDTGLTVLNEAVNPVITETFAPEMAASANPLQILIPIAAWIWVAGMALLLVYTALSYAVLSRKVAGARLLRYNIYLSEHVDTPFVLGFFRPRVYLPLTMSQTDIIYVISHEKAHIRRHDHWWKPLGFLVLILHWFNPLMWLSYRLFSRDMELACDEDVIRRLDSGRRAEYAEALLACSVGRPLITACPIAFGEVGVKIRVKSILNYRKPGFWLMVTAVIACAVLMVCFLTDPKTETVPAEAAVSTAPAEAVEPTAKETEAAETTVSTEAAEPSHQEVADLAYFMELSAPGKAFRDMSPERKVEIIPEYGGLLDGYDIIARESTDGELCYIVGCWPGKPEESPLYHLRSSFTEINGAEAQVFYDLRELETAEKYVEPRYKYVIHNSQLNHASTTGHFLIRPVDSGWDFDAVLSKYLRPNGREYILDAVSRGISIGTPEGAYLEVTLISPQWGEISEKIALTEEQVSQILAEERKKLEPGYGFAAWLEPGPNSALNLDFDSLYYTEARGVPQTVLDLAVEKCGYQFAAPADIRSDIVEARLDCDWLEEPLYVAKADLPKLQSILKNAEFGFVGKCGYGARLTMKMADGRELVAFKGTDGCDTMVFGSYGGYFLGDDNNLEFWYLFGLEPNSKQPLS